MIFHQIQNIKIKDVIEDNYILYNITNQIKKSIFDNIEYLEDKNNNDDKDDYDNQTNNINNNLSNQKGGNNKIIGIYELENGLGKIISTVPICKIANIIQWIK